MLEGSPTVAGAVSKHASWQCSCGRYAELECDWPAGEGFCAKPVCKVCVRRIEGRDCCPFHRGDPPWIARPLEPTPEELGEAAANEAARILGIKR